MFMTVFKKDFFRENKRFLPGLALFFFGLLLVFHARYDVLSPNKNASVVPISQILSFWQTQQLRMLISPKSKLPISPAAFRTSKLP